MVLLVVLLAACSSAITPQPSPSLPAASQGSTPSLEPSSSRPPNASPDASPDLELYDILTVIADEPLVLRSAPGTGSDSAILEPRLYQSMTVRVLEGPVSASGYDWYRVAAGSTEGWAAAGRLVGDVHEPWLAWATNGLIAYGADAGSLGGVPQVFVMDGDGGDRRQLTDLDNSDLQVATASSTGNVLALTCGTSADPIEWSAAYGRLAFAVGSCAKAVYVANADGSRLRRVADGSAVTWSPDGLRVAGSLNVPYSPAGCTDQGPWDLWTLDLRSGTRTLVTRSDRCVIASSPDWSPDGRSIAFTATHASFESGATVAAWVVDLATGVERQVTLGWRPQWSPDGTRLLVERVLDTNGGDPGCGDCTGEVYSVGLTGGDEIAYGTGYGAAWSPGGDYVAFHRFTATADRADVVVMRADGAGEMVLPIAGLLQGWSPDGRHLLVTIGQELWRYPLAGGQPVWLADLVSGGVAWQSVPVLLTGTGL
jgi:Tol biopolymer transport system component